MQSTKGSTRIEYETDDFLFDEFEIEKYIPEFIKVLRRGVISVHQIGYV